jgi:hypothetical protein
VFNKIKDSSKEQITVIQQPVKTVKTNDENQKKLIKEQINSLKAETGISGGKRRTKRRRTNKDAFMFTKNMVIVREGI